MDQQALVFEQWVEQHPGLKSLVQGKLPSTLFEDTFQWKNHAFRSDFANYLSKFCAQILSSFSSLEQERDIANVVSYLCLFTMEDQQFMEQKIVSGFFQKLKNELSTSKNANTETALLKIVDTVSNDQISTLINSLSRKSYLLKTRYVDEVLTLLDHPACTARLAYRLIKQLKEIELNPEHVQTIHRVENDLKSGVLFSKERNRTISGRSLIRPILILLLISTCALGVYYFVEHQKVEKDDLNIASSFEDFSVEERKQIDSLIKTMQGKESIERETDIFQWLGNGVILSIRQPLRNERMELMYNDWLLDAALFENAQIDSCSYSSNSSFPEVLSLKDLNGKENIFLRNESAYQSFVFVFDDFYNGKVYSTLIKKGETLQFKMNKNQGLLLVPGNDLSRYIRPNGLADEVCPSKKFTTHFCQTDGNLQQALSSIYRLSLPADKNKLMLVGDSVTQFSVIDLNGILETF